MLDANWARKWLLDDGRLWNDTRWKNFGPALAARRRLFFSRTLRVDLGFRTIRAEGSRYRRDAADDPRREPASPRRRGRSAPGAAASTRPAAHRSGAYGKGKRKLEDESDDEGELLNVNSRAHCYICKQWGHSKKDCPLARCQY